MALVTLGFLALAGQLHSRKIRSRESHPSTRARTESPIPLEETPGSKVTRTAQEPAGIGESVRGESESQEPPLPRSRIRHIEAHRGIPELIHALGHESDAPGEPDAGLNPIAEVFAVPPRFDRHINEQGYLDLEALLMEVLEETAYEVRPVRGDLIATKGDERLMLRVLPWDGTYSTVGRRSIERFAGDFRKSGATDGICLSEAAMPAAAMAMESETAGLWFVGRGRLARFLESLDGAMAFGSGPPRDDSLDKH